MKPHFLCCEAVRVFRGRQDDGEKDREEAAK